MRGPRTTWRLSRTRTRLPAAHPPRHRHGADERLAQAAAELHARGELGHVEAAQLEVVELGERVSASDAAPAATMFSPASVSEGAIADA